MTRDPKEMLIRAQIYLTYLRRPLRNRDQQEWDDLSEAIVLIEKCLKLLEGE